MRINLSKTLSPIMFLLAFSAVSCFDDKYDLKKDIDLTVTVGSEKMVVPLGETEEITLDKIIDTTETFKLGDDGTYAFKKKDKIDDVNIDVETVHIDIDDPDIDPIKVEFGESTEIDPFEVDIADPTFPVDVADIEVDRSKLPRIDLSIEEPIKVLTPGLVVPEDFKINVSEKQEISLTLGESTFKDIKSVKEVWFGDENGKQVVDFRVDTKALRALFKPGSKQYLEELKAEFPDGFVLSADDSYNNTLHVNGNVLTMKNVDLSDKDELVCHFYVDKFVHTFDSDHLNYEDSLCFSLVYGVEGTFVEEFGKEGNLSAQLSVDDEFKFDKAIVVTEDVSVDVAPGTFDFSTDVENLDELDQVKRIDFVKDSKFTLALNPLNLPFNFQETSKFCVEIPEILNVELNHEIEGVKLENHRLVISGEYLKHPATPIVLNLISIDFDKYGKGMIVDSVLTINETLTYYAESEVDGQIQKDVLVVQGGNDISTEDLLGMHRDIVLTTDCSTAGTGLLEVENALVVANAVSSEVNTTADFDVREEDIPEEVKSLKEVYLANDGIAKFVLKVNFKEMPKEIKKGISMAPLTVDLPKFIVFVDNPDIDANNVMTLRETFIPSEANEYTYVKSVEVKGLDFTKIDEYADGLKIGDDHVLTIPNKYSTVTVTGKVTTAAGEEVNSNKFEDFQIYPEVTVDNMIIGKVVGKVDPKIDQVEELVDLELDEDMDFLKSDSSELHIQNPIIKVKLQNTVGVPVNLDLKIAGYKQGSSQPIEGSEVGATTATHPNFKLYPAINGDTVTTNILISRELVELQEGDAYNKYVNVVISDLSDLLVHLPDQVKFTLDAKADQSVDHEVDITPNAVGDNGKEMARFLVKGDYDVTVPLVFDSLNINYTDSIDNLNEDLWDFLDVAISAELEVNADLTNQLPADLNLSAFAVDRMGKALNTIHVDVFVNDKKDGIIPGVTSEGEQVVVPIRIEVKAANTDELKKLDKLRLNVNAVISQTKAGVPLKAKQSVQFKNIKACVKKVNLDLN